MLLDFVMKPPNYITPPLDFVVTPLGHIGRGVCPQQYVMCLFECGSRLMAAMAAPFVGDPIDSLNSLRRSLDRSGIQNCRQRAY